MQHRRHAISSSVGSLLTSGDSQPAEEAAADAAPSARPIPGFCSVELCSRPKHYHHGVAEFLGSRPLWCGCASSDQSAPRHAESKLRIRQAGNGPWMHSNVGLCGGSL